MNNENLYTCLKREFNNLNETLVNEGIDEIICRCFNQVKENINYLDDNLNEEKFDSLNSNSKYIDRTFKIRETQQLFKYCILLLEREVNIKPQYKLILENLLSHFQRIFLTEDKYLHRFTQKNKFSSQNSLLLSTGSQISVPKPCDLEEKLLHEQNKGKYQV
ncbi:hypothetical protein FG386_002637 [Cryptosporidium ryanae]|uniref:uncharacterized protein n=1 Tax=Cryptosporidium ryanae TaxID=515981 RepID=UPI003519E844|nr:hypothetical protein FG386_002637 [Cryptosporidium ryanae]